MKAVARARCRRARVVAQVRVERGVVGGVRAACAAGSAASPPAARARLARRRGSERAPGARRPASSPYASSNASSACVAAARGGAHDVVREKAAQGAAVDDRAGRRERRRTPVRASSEQADQLDTRLAALAAPVGAHRGPRIRSQSRTRSTGLRQSFAIRRSSEYGIGSVREADLRMQEAVTRALVAEAEDPRPPPQHAGAASGPPEERTPAHERARGEPRGRAAAGERAASRRRRRAGRSRGAIGTSGGALTMPCGAPAAPGAAAPRLAAAARRAADRVQQPWAERVRRPRVARIGPAPPGPARQAARARSTPRSPARCSPRMTGDRTSARRTGGHAGATSALQRNDDALGGAGLRRLDHAQRGDAGVERDRWRLTAARPNRPLHPLVELDVASRLRLDRLRVAPRCPAVPTTRAAPRRSRDRRDARRIEARPPARRDPTSRTRRASRAPSGAVQAARRAWSRRDGSARPRSARARGRRRRPPPRPDRTRLTSAYTERAGPSSSST